MIHRNAPMTDTGRAKLISFDSLLNKVNNLVRHMRKGVGAPQRGIARNRRPIGSPKSDHSQEQDHYPYSLRHHSRSLLVLGRRYYQG